MNGHFGLDRDRNWDSESFYVTPKGVPIVYSVEAQADPDGLRDNNYAYLLQVYDTRNSANPELQVPTSLVVTTLADDGPGSLRNAIRYGGKVTFSDALDGGTITLTSGQLIPYLHNVEIDASSLPHGITINGGRHDRVFLIPAGNVILLSNLTIEKGKPAVSGPMALGGGILNHGELTIRNCTIRDNEAESGGGIWNDGDLAIDTSGTASSAIALAAGANSITIAVTAQDGTTVKGYFVTVTRAPGSTGELPPTQNSYRDKVMSDGPVAYWRLNETSGTVAQDSVGARHGTYLNNPTLGLPGAPFGTTSTSVGFESSRQQKVDVAYSAALNPAIFTAELWAKVPNRSSDYRPLLASHDYDTHGHGYIFYAVDDTWDFWYGSSSITWQNLFSPTVRFGAWTYLAATYDGTTVRFYINGVEEASTAIGFIPNTSTPLRIGSDGAYFLDGSVDEVAVYNKALTAQQIAAHFAARTPPAAADVTQPGDPIVSTHAANRSPAAELVANAIDNNPNTKYLNFGDGSDTAEPLTGDHRFHRDASRGGIGRDRLDIDFGERRAGP